MYLSIRLHDHIAPDDIPGGRFSRQTTPTQGQRKAALYYHTNLVNAWDVFVDVHFFKVLQLMVVSQGKDHDCR